MLRRFDGSGMLGSLSPLQALRGMLDTSLGHWRQSPLLHAVRATFFIVLIWGLVAAMNNPVGGLVIAILTLCALLAIRPR